MTIQNQVVRVDGEQLDIKQLRLWLGQALKIFSTGNSVVLLKRKVNLRGFLDSKFHHLLKPTYPVTQELLGRDLEQKILDGTRASEVGKKIATFSRKSHWSGNNFRMSRDREQGRRTYRGVAGRDQDRDSKACRGFGRGFTNRAFPNTGAIRGRGSQKHRFRQDKRCGGPCRPGHYRN